MGGEGGGVGVLRALVWGPSDHDSLEVGEAAMIPDILKPVMAWHCWGDAQQGHLEDDRLWLEAMITLTPSIAIGESARDIITSWMGRRDLRGAGDSIILDALCDILETIEFKGSLKPITFQEGFVFPSRTLKDEPVQRVIVATQIKWAMGAPGFIQTLSETAEPSYMTCMLVGWVREDNAQAIMV